MTYVLIAGGILAAVALVFLLFRIGGKLPPWGHRDLLAFIALVATIGGAMVLTLLKWVQTDKFNQQTDRLITEILRERPSAVNESVGKALTTIVDALTWDLQFTSIGIIVVLLSLGLVISSRIIKGKVFGNEFEMRTEAERQAAVEAARETAGAAQEKSKEIAAEAGKPGEGELLESEKIK